MQNLEELCLYVYIVGRDRFVDGTQLHNDILTHMPQLRTFVFYVGTRRESEQPIPHLSVEDIHRTFTDIGYDQVACFVENDADYSYVFSVPFLFDTLSDIGNIFPDLIYSTVTYLFVSDVPRFQHEFFVRIARCFPMLKSFCIYNPQTVLQLFCPIQPHDNQPPSMIEYPHLRKLGIKDVEIDLVEKFLDESRVRLPRLIELAVEYENLLCVTENFTRDLTRSTCRKVKRLLLHEQIVPPATFHDYFPLVNGFFLNWWEFI